MGKRAGTGACQPTPISQRPRRRRKKTPELDDAAAASSLSFCSATSQAERQRSRQGKKKPISAPGLRSTATAQAQAQARLRRRDLSVSWRAKRLRTARSGPTVGSRWRDWAGLPEGPAGLIADRVLANDVADYVRFRAACVPWRRCCTDPRARGVLEDPRLYPRRWIMLLDDDYEKLDGTAAGRHGIIRRRFLNTGTGQCVQADVPELRDHGVLRGAADGLLVLYHEASKVVRLLNPLTRQVAELPPTTTGLVKCEPCGAGLVDHGTVYLYSYDSTMAIARPGDDRWTLLDSRVVFSSTAFSAGRFYALTGSGIVTVDMAGGSDGGPRLVVAAELPKPFSFSAMTDTEHLVDNGDGDLRLVHRMLRAVRDYDGDGDITYKRRYRYRVYRVDLSTGKTTDRGRRNLGGRAIFFDYYGALSVSPRVFPFLSEDTIYLGLHCGERHAPYGHIGAYHVRDGSTEPPCNDDDSQRRGLVHPLSIADSLIAFVSG